MKKEEVSNFNEELGRKPKEKTKIVDVKTGSTIFYLEMLIIVIVGAVAMIIGSYWMGPLILIGGYLLIRLWHKNQKERH